MNHEYKSFLQKIEAKIPTVIKNNQSPRNEEMFIALNDLFVISLALDRMDEEFEVIRSFESELSEFVSRYAIFSYLGDEYILQSIMRAMLESTYRLICSAYYPLRRERRIRGEGRRNWSNDIEQKLTQENVHYLTDLNLLYARYSSEIHNDGVNSKNIWHRLNSFGFNVGDKSNQINDLKSIYKCLVMLYPFKERHKFINAAEKLFLEHRLSQLAFSIFNGTSA